jgi:hypothetical protein
VYRRGYDVNLSKAADAADEIQAHAVAMAVPSTLKEGKGVFPSVPPFPPAVYPGYVVDVDDASLWIFWFTAARGGGGWYNFRCSVCWHCMFDFTSLGVLKAALCSEETLHFPWGS